VQFQQIQIPKLLSSLGRIFRLLGYVGDLQYKQRAFLAWLIRQRFLEQIVLRTCWTSPLICADELQSSLPGNRLRFAIQVVGLES